MRNCSPSLCSIGMLTSGMILFLAGSPTELLGQVRGQLPQRGSSLPIVSQRFVDADNRRFVVDPSGESILERLTVNDLSIQNAEASHIRDSDDQSFVLDPSGRSRLKHLEVEAIEAYGMSIERELTVGTVLTNGVRAQFFDGELRGSAPGNPYVVRPEGNSTLLGTVTASGFAEHSDRRLKKRIEPLGDVLTDLARLRPVSFSWREASERAVVSDEIQYGLVAQEVAEVFPHLVSEGEDGMLRINSSDLPILLLQAVRELERRTTQLAALETRLSRIEALLEGPFGERR